MFFFAGASGYPVFENPVLVEVFAHGANRGTRSLELAPGSIVLAAVCGCLLANCILCVCLTS